MRRGRKRKGRREFVLCPRKRKEKSASMSMLIGLRFSQCVFKVYILRWISQHVNACHQPTNAAQLSIDKSSEKPVASSCVTCPAFVRRLYKHSKIQVRLQLGDHENIGLLISSLNFLSVFLWNPRYNNFRDGGHVCFRCRYSLLSIEIDIVPIFGCRL